MSRKYSPLDVARNRAKKLKKLIEILDSLRARKRFNGLEAKKLLEDLGYEDEPWSSVRDAVDEIASVPLNHPLFPKLRRYDGIASQLLTASFAGLVASAVLMFLNMSETLTFYILLATLAMLNVSYVLKLYVTAKVKSIYAESGEVFEKHEQLFYRAINTLIARLRGELKKARIEPSEVRLKLYNDDYTGIRILKRKKGYVEATLK